MSHANLHSALRNLRHLYEQMLDGRVQDQVSAANGLLSPAIAHLEHIDTQMSDAARFVNATGRANEILLEKVAELERRLAGIQADANRALETYRERSAELSAASAVSKFATDEMRTALSWFYASIDAGEIDIVHEDECPMDDTCECPVAATVHQLQRAANLCSVTYQSIRKVTARKNEEVDP